MVQSPWYVPENCYGGRLAPNLLIFAQFFRVIWAVLVRTEQTKLQRRLEAMYDDKLDGLIDAEVYKSKSAEIQAEQARLA